MKKTLSFATVICVICFLTCLTSCEEILNALLESSDTSSSTESSNAVPTTATLDNDTWTYSDTTAGRVHEVTNNQYKVTITELPTEKTLYLTKTNATVDRIPETYARYITDTTGIDRIESSRAAANRSAQNGGSADELDSIDIPVQKPRFTYFTPPVKTSELESAYRKSARSAGASRAAVTQIEHEVGAKAYIYIDYDRSMKNYKPYSATIRAIGTYCNVWVVDNYYSTTASSDSNKISGTTIPSDYASFFDAMYPMITNVFGNESNVMRDGSKLSSASPTGEYINIVLYDIGGGDSSNGSVLGYFYSKDYYPTSSCSYSNLGKYFYIDSYYANKELKTTYSTLAHEFQHMVDYNTKTIKQNLISDQTWWGEMMSMLCEDMMQSQLGIDDADSPKGRLKSFNMYGSYVGIEYRDDNTSYESLSYSTAYAFGCWLARNFGGTKLIKEMSTNAYMDYDCVVNAVNTVNGTSNGTSYTFADLMRMYTESLIFRDTSLSMPTFNKAAAAGIYYPSGATASTATYAYPMTAVDLWDPAYEWMVNTSDLASYPYNNNTTNGTGTYMENGTTYNVTYLLGPQMFGYNEAAAMRPYGIKLCKVGTITSSTVTVTFNKTCWEGGHVYLMVQ